MKKRTVLFGVPVYVLRHQVLPLIVINGVLALFFVLMPGVVLDYITDKTIENRLHGMLFLVSIAFLPLISSAWVFVRMSRYMKRMKRLKGRACFVCNYEIAEGLDRCSECGAVWSLDDLNASWRKNVGGE